MIQCKYYISIHRNLNISKIDRCWYQRKGIPQSYNYGSYLSPEIYTFDSYLDNNEDNFEFFDINNNNETEPGCIFDENLFNFNQPDDNEEKRNNLKSILFTETLSYKSFILICNELYNVMKNNKEIPIIVVGMLLERKEVIISKQNTNLHLNRIIKHFSNFKHTFTPLEK